ncbi:DUF3999 family protein [Paenibacillus borealis]|uniref:DUF3999 domain-containing protein n=1 Tax=Paenibacillus borealis TaxID=160799 RepID=A0A089LN56_PAEBO|nr:DUF3999 family protein [Paenibacillus borealis]AIQ61500.1 hypothetical protein PBOR_34815 [Paenibacillus borealis]
MRSQRKTGWRARTAVLLAGLGGMMLFTSAYPAQGMAASGWAEKAESGQWKVSRAIGIPEPAPYYELYLDEGVYALAAEDLRDLRITGSTGEPVPYYLESGEETVEARSTAYSSILIHRADKGADTLLDYRITPLAEHVDIQGNKLVFELPDESFLKHVEVWGGYDGNAWEPLAKGDLYATNGLSADSIELEGSYKFSFYRLVVKSNPEGLDFPGLTLVDSSREVKMAGFMRQKTPPYEISQAENRTEIVISNKDRLKITKLTLGSTGNFSRRYELYDSEGIRIPVAGSGELYRLDFKDTRISQTDIRLLNASSSSALRILIYNLDDAPISIAGLKAEYLVDRLVFAGGEQETGSYSLIYGNALALAPQYDIINFKDQIAGGKLVTATLGAENIIPEAAAEPPAQSGWFQSEWGFNLIIIAVSLLLILIVARKLGRTK